MHLYGLTLQTAGAITHSIVGNFSGSKHQELLVSHGKTLELFAPDEQEQQTQQDSNKFHSIFSTEIFGIVRALLPFRLTG
jgi:splicing factor 3B subunit 3